MIRAQTARTTSGVLRLGSGLLLLALCAGTLTTSVPTTSVVHKDENFITAETTGILDIEAGECFTDPTYLPSAGEPVVLYRPCPETADNQSYAFIHAADSPWSRPDLVTFAWSGCRSAFDNRWPTGKELAFYPILPTEETWADGDRDIMCAVYNPRGRLKDSALPLN
jgi:hypothetical protein